MLHLPKIKRILFHFIELHDKKKCYTYEHKTNFISRVYTDSFVNSYPFRYNVRMVFFLFRIG